MTRGTLILLVEDDADLGALLEEIIRSRGYRTRLCKTGAQALACLAREVPALAVLDWGLPDTDPEDLARSFRELGVPVVLASGAGRTQEIAETIGAEATLQKPYAIDDVFSVLERFVGPAPLPNHS